MTQKKIVSFFLFFIDIALVRNQIKETF